MKMKLLAIIIFLSSCGTYTQIYHPITYDRSINYAGYSQIQYEKPLIVFIETDPWAMILGYDTPSFVLYDSGQVVYKYIENNQFYHYYVNLKNNEISNLINFFNITDELYNSPYANSGNMIF